MRFGADPVRRTGCAPVAAAARPGPATLPIPPPITRLPADPDADTYVSAWLLARGLPVTEAEPLPDESRLPPRGSMADLVDATDATERPSSSQGATDCVLRVPPPPLPPAAADALARPRIPADASSAPANADASSIAEAEPCIGPGIMPLRLCPPPRAILPERLPAVPRGAPRDATPPDDPPRCPRPSSAERTPVSLPTAVDYALYSAREAFANSFSHSCWSACMPDSLVST